MVEATVKVKVVFNAIIFIQNFIQIH
jgi:hypothetical protein